jgi:hypothetical protein
MAKMSGKAAERPRALVRVQFRFRLHDFRIAANGNCAVRPAGARLARMTSVSYCGTSAAVARARGMRPKATEGA